MQLGTLIKKKSGESSHENLVTVIFYCFIQILSNFSSGLEKLAEYL